jgi:hypothetical protein
MLFALFLLVVVPGIFAMSLVPSPVTPQPLDGEVELLRKIAYVLGAQVDPADGRLGLLRKILAQLVVMEGVETGSAWHSGDGIPASSLGLDGDFYLDIGTGDIYEKVSGSYLLRGNFLGSVQVNRFTTNVDGTPVVGDVAFTGSATAGATNGAARFTLGNASGNNQGRIVFYTSNADYNWQIAVNYNLAGGLEITPSDTAGGSNYTQPLIRVQPSNRGVGIGIAPGARLHVPAGTASNETAPFRVEPGVLNTTPASGCIESDGTHLYWVDAGGNRKQLDN